MRNCIAFGLLAVIASVMAGGINHSNNNNNNYDHYNYAQTADIEFLHKQKKIFDLLTYVDQNVLVDAEYYEIGRNYDVYSNVDHYTNREFVMDFLTYYKIGFLDKDSLFTYYNPEHREQMMMLYRLFYFAKDFATFYKTACWARLHFNPHMFTAAFTTAVIYRNDTKHMQLPAIYEIYPQVFFDSKVIHDAYRLKMTKAYHRGFHDRYHREFDRVDAMSSSSITTDIETYYLRYNFTGFCANPIYEHEYKMAYFTEDVGLNAFYYYFRMAYPFWMSTKDYDVPKSFRGDLYYFYHKQLMARYHLERYANGFDEIDDFTWDSMNLPGYHSNLVYSNGIAMPRRDWWNVVPYYKHRHLETIKLWEGRIMDAIDSGFFYDEFGKQINLFTPEGLNHLGNLIEGNGDSYNWKYYGAYDALAREILGVNYHNYQGKNNYHVPSSLEYFSTSLRDPAFYRIYDKIMYFFHRYKSLLHKYEKTELEFPGVKFVDVDVEKLFTYFDEREYYINNAVAVDSFKEGNSYSIKAVQPHINHKPFVYKFNVNSDKDTKGVVRVFLGPATMDGKYDHSYFMRYYKYFFMMDEFDVNLKTGMNQFERRSTESRFFKDLDTNGQLYYRKVLKAMEGGEPFSYNSQMFGFPSYLTLPKGTTDGTKFTMFFYVGPYEQPKIIDFPVFGPHKFYGKSCGFPMDRPMYPWFFKLDNVFFKDVYVHHVNDRRYNDPIMSMYDRRRYNY